MRKVIRKSVAQQLVFFALILATGFHSTPSCAELGFVELPEIQSNKIAPRVIYIENPRFPKVDVQDLRIVIQSAADLVHEHFGVTLKQPSDIQVLNIDDVFLDVVKKKRRNFGKSVGDFRNGKVDWGRVKEFLARQIKKEKESLSEQIEFARPHLLRPVDEETRDGFAEAVIETFKIRLTHWTVAKLEDGYPVIGQVPGRPDLPLNEYVYWALMTKLGIDAEIILTNQLVASVEYMPIPIHTSIRGGITGGSTEYNPSSRLGSSVWVSLFPYLSNDSRIIELRNGDSFSRQDALSYAGVMLAHELGHQLFQLGHPWSNPACVMRPVEALDFTSWVKGLDAKACQIGSSPAMIPGTTKAPIW